jgi:hypothetical protein
MSTETADPPQKPQTSNDYLAAFRDYVKIFPMKMPEGMRFTAAVLADLSLPYKDAPTEEQKLLRVVRAMPSQIAERTDATVRTVGRRLEWLAANGFIKVLKAPRRGNGARGVWLLQYVDWREMEAFVEPASRELERKRLAQIVPKTASAVPPNETAVPPQSNGGTAVSKRRTRRLESAHAPIETAEAPLPSRDPTPETPAAPVAPAPPAVPPFGRGPVPGSSGPRPGLPAPVADDVLGEPQGVDDGDQPQDAQERAGAPGPEMTWAQQMAAKIKDEWESGLGQGGRLVSGGPVPAPGDPMSVV